MDHDLEYLKAKVQAESPYNDGWTRQFYQEIVDKYEHINDDPHDGWWLQPEYQDSEDEDKRQESN
tara:strand:- start:303 stop:497 length:195 start_codon:yes stop_codon:yes gene_type:complete